MAIELSAAFWTYRYRDRCLPDCDHPLSLYQTELHESRHSKRHRMVARVRCTICDRWGRRRVPWRLIEAY